LLENIIPEELSPFPMQFKYNSKKLSCCGFVEKLIPARIAKLQAMDKIMDKPRKTRRVSHNLPTILPTTFSKQF